MLAVAPASWEAKSLPRLIDLPEPVPQGDEVLVEVRAAGINRADLLQLRGLYPPPAGESEVPGLEASGEILRVGAKVSGWKPGDRIMALVAGGAQAERMAVPAGQLMPLPEAWSFEEGAALPEAAITAWTNLVEEGGLRSGEWVLVSGATGGVGSFAVALAQALGARVAASGRDRKRLSALEAHGAELLLVEGSEMVEALSDQVPDGVDLVLELVAGPMIEYHLQMLRPQGRLVLVGVVGGARAEIDLGLILRRRIEVQGSTLRSRSRAEKAELIAAFVDFAAPRFAQGLLRPMLARVSPLTEVAEAYRTVAEGGVVGKTVLVMPRRA